MIYFATLGSYFLLLIPRGCGKQMGDEAQLFHVVTTSVKRYLLSGFSFCSASGRQPGRHQAPSYICGAEVLTPIPSLAKHVSDRDRNGDLPHVRQIRHKKPHDRRRRMRSILIHLNNFLCSAKNRLRGPKIRPQTLKRASYINRQVWPCNVGQVYQRRSHL